MKDGKYDVDGTATLTAPTDMKANEGFKNGAWDVTIPEIVSGTETLTYTYSYIRSTTPVEPLKNVSYIVEHYKADAAGEYKIVAEDTEILSGKIGDTVTGTPKSYEGYCLNALKSEATMSGVLKAITSNADIVTLKLYYARNSYGYTVNYLEKDTGKVLATAKTGTATYGETVNETAIAIKDYVVVGENNVSVTIVEDVVINFYYSKDIITVNDNDPGIGGDGIPDAEQDEIYLVEYYLQTISGAYKLDYKKYFVAKAGDFVTAAEREYDDYCLNTAKSEISGVVKEINEVSDILTLKLYYDIDAIGGGKNGDEGDGIPDNIQKKVIFKVVSGTWADGTTEDIIKFVTLVDGTGKFDAPEGMIAYNENSEGAWYDASNKYLGDTLNETVTGVNTVVYTYKFVEITVPETPEGDLDGDDDIYGDDDSAQTIVFGKTDAIGWYEVSLDGGQTYQIVFGNSTLEVEYGTELIIKASDIMGDSFTFYVNGDAVKPNDDGEIRVTVNGYMLIGAIGIDPDVDFEVPDAEESLNWFQRIIKAIKDFFAKLFGKK